MKVYPVPYAKTDSVRTNLLTNPTASVNVTGWSVYAGTGGATSAVSRDTVTSVLDTLGATIPVTTRVGYSQTTTSTGPGGLYIDTPAGSVTVGQNVSASAYVAASPNQSMRVQIAWYDASSTRLSSTAGTTQTVLASSSGYVRLTATGTAPTSTDHVRIEVYSVAGVPSGQVVRVAAVLVERTSSVGAYFDGDTPDEFNGSGLPVARAWTGTVGASVSTETTRTPTSADEHAPTLVTTYGADRTSRSVRHEIIDRADPVFSLAPLAYSTGTLDLFFTSYTLAKACADAHTADRMLLVDADESQRTMYYVPSRVRLEPAQPMTIGQPWMCSVDYQQVALDSSGY